MKKIAQLHYITNGQTEEEILQEVQDVVDAGIDWIQLRIKNADIPFLEIAKKAREICRNSTLIINDKVDVAKAVNADGVHLGKEDMPVDKAREILGDDKIIGGTANDLADCLNLQLKGADYIGLGPYRFTKTKKKLSAVLGLEGYQKIVPCEEKYGSQLNSITLPVLAIGGIQLEDIEKLMNNTCLHGIAVSGLIYNADSKKDMARDILKKLATNQSETEMQIEQA
ncbi:MAG: thiamine phosphate synthase [Crocinitomicaceae bacterium]